MILLRIFEMQFLKNKTFSMIFNIAVCNDARKILFAVAKVLASSG